jgi:hypothetical protein
MQWSALKRFWMFDDPRSYGARGIMRAAAEGLRANGKDVRLCPLDVTTPNHAQQLRDDVLAFQPDAILLANHPSSLFVKQIGLHDLVARFFVWIFDDPFMMGDESFSSDEIVWVSDPGFEQGVRDRGGEHVFFLPVAAPHIHGENTEASIYPLTYVGATAVMTHFTAQMTSAMQAYFSKVIAMKIAFPQKTFRELLQETPLAEGKYIQCSGQVAYYLYAEANRLSRLSYLQGLDPCQLRLYGNDAWVPQIQGTGLEACYVGPIEPIHDYPRLIRQSAINLNLRSLQGFYAPTHRDFLVPALGSFLLSTKRHAGIGCRLPETYDLLTFPWSPEAADPDEFARSVAFYTEHPQQRKDWIQDAQQEILNKHTYAHRFDTFSHLFDREF